jgi:phage/plasmid-associated DNA primase
MPDIALIQRWAGLALLGVNLSQKILLLTGTPGGGKSTLVSVLTGIIGKGNVGMLRTELLGDRFEIGRLSGKTLHYGPDVPWDLRLTETQQRRVDDLLLESDPHRVFVTECLTKDASAPGMTKADVYAAFVEFCDRRGWVAMNKNRFGKLGAEAIAQAFGLGVRGDIPNGNGKLNDGWKSLRLRAEKDML